MPCFSPLAAWQPLPNNPAGATKLVFGTPSRPWYKPIKVGCDQCIGCRLDYSRNWAVRCAHEAHMFGTDNEFITLTYNNDHLPPDLSLQKRHFQKFMKRLRKEIEGVHTVFNEDTGKCSRPIRYYHCGEYGDRFKRPHYHACLFNVRFPDRVHFKTINGVRLYTSDLLSRIWGKGFVSTGDVTFESAAYVARYMTKKIKGKNAAAHYQESFDIETGEVFLARQPEYCTMSLKPGIGRSFYEKYKADIYSIDSCIVRRDVRCKPPKYYDALYKVDNPDHWAEIADRRCRQMEKYAKNNTEDRLNVRETVLLRRIEKLKRTYESGETLND